MCNDLDVFNLPDQFSDIRRLEKVIISKRLLYKKITIMPKGLAPKMKSTICNIPINAEDICNVLPRGMDNNGIVRVALKKRMQFKSNVYFEPVRPDFTREVLLYLKANNALYADIEINISNIPTFWINDINNNGDIDRNFEINENATESGQSDVDFSIEGKSGFMAQVCSIVH